MKIKLAILDGDARYLTGISTVFNSKFADKVETYSFQNLSLALSSLKESRINVFISSDNFEIDTSLLPKHCGFAYFVELPSVESYKDNPAIFKYQKPEMIYKIIANMFSENLHDDTIYKGDGKSNLKVITFVSASGGVGASSAAAACAKSFAAKGHNTLYLNLEHFGIVEPFFSGAGQMGFYDVILSLKSKRTNLFMKLDSIVRRDASGVFFFADSPNANDMFNLQTEEIEKLLKDLKLTGTYEYIIIDIDFSLDSTALLVFKQSANIVFVSDGSEISNLKFIRAYKAIENMEDKFDHPLTPRIAILYNKFSNKTSKAVDNGIRTIGGAPRYEHATTEQVVSQLVSLDFFQKI